MEFPKLKFNKIGILAVLGIFLSVLAAVFFYFSHTKSALAAWWDDDWHFRRPVTVTNNTSAQQDVYISLTVDTSSTTSFQSDCGDLRFTKSNGSLLSYFIVSGCQTANTVVHVNFDVFEAGQQLVYYYYGNPSAPNGFSASDFKALASNYSVGAMGAEEKSEGPIAYWKFDEGYGTVAHDESSYKNHGTVSNAVWRPESDCAAGKCLSFANNVTDDNITGTLGKGIASSSFTISAWFYQSATTSGDIIGIGSFPGIDNAVHLRVYSDGRVYFGFWNNDLSSPAGKAVAGKWNHVEAVYSKENSYRKIYLNGVQIAGDNNSSDFKGDNVFYLGSIAWDSEKWKGRIDEPKVYDYARSADQIKQDYNAGVAGLGTSRGASVSLGGSSDKWLTDGLVGYWKMDEASGTIVADSSIIGSNGTLANAQETGTSDASGNTGTVMVDSDGALASFDDAYNGMILRITSACNGISAGTEKMISDYAGSTKTFTIGSSFPNLLNGCAYEIRHQRGGRYGNAMKFDGANDYVAIPDNLNSYDLAQTYFSASVWVKLFATGTTNYILSKKGNVNRGWYLMVLPAGEVQLGGDGVASCSTKTGVNAIADTNWHNIVVTRNVSAFSIYIDGIEMPLSPKIENMPQYGNGGLYAGAKAPTTGEPTLYSAHYVDDIRIYNRALTPDDAKKLYEYGPDTVMRLKMDENGGNKAYDSSGNGHDGAISGAVWTMGKIGTALSFDGNDYIPFTGFALPPAGSFSAWVQSDFDETSEASDHVLVSDGSGATPYFRLRYQGGANHRYLFSAGSVTVFLSPETADTRGWWHISATWDETGCKLYKNGRPWSSQNGYGRNGMGVNAIIGADATNYTTYATTNNWKGKIDDVRIYDYVRTQKQILEDMNAGAPALRSPILEFNFDEGFGSTTYDQSGRGNNGVLVASSSGNVSAAAMRKKNGKFGSAIDFDGTDDRVEFTCNGCAGGTYPHSVSLWFNPDTLSGTKVLMSDPMAGASIAYSGGTFIHIGTSVYRLGAPLSYIKVGNWYHLVAVFNSVSDRKLYINGVDRTVATDDYWGTDSYYVIGGRNDTGGYTPFRFDGRIDEVKIYNYALSPDEVKALYNGNNAMSLGGQTSAANNNGTTVLGDAAKYCVPGDTAKCDKPVLELKLDEKTGTTAYDTSGNGYDGTLANGPVWGMGKNGSAVELDGVDDTVSFPSFVGDQTNSFEFWAKPRGSGDTVMGMNGDANCQLKVSSASLGYRVMDGTTIVSSTTSNNLNSWNHFAFIRNGSYVSFYKNGLQAGYTGVGTASDIRVNILGARSNQEYFKGSIDDVRIYDYARTPAQIAWDYNRGKPMAYWRFDEGLNATVHDESVNKNNGTITGAAWATAANCKYGKCLYFDGNSDAVVTNGNDLSQTDQMSIAFWFKYPAASTQVVAELSSNFNSNNAFFIDHSESGAGQLAFADHCGAVFNSIATDASYGDNKWHHFVGTINRGLTADFENKIYIDGQPVSTRTLIYGECTGNFGSYPLYLGARGGTSLGYNGLLDDVKLFSYALTPEQAKTEYNGGAASFK